MAENVEKAGGKMKLFCREKRKTYCFLWPNAFIISVFGFGLFICRHYAFNWFIPYLQYKKRFWEFKILTPLNSGPVIKTNDKSYTIETGFGYVTHTETRKEVTKL